MLKVSVCPAEDKQLVSTCSFLVERVSRARMGSLPMVTLDDFPAVTAEGARDSMWNPMAAVSPADVPSLLLRG